MAGISHHLDCVQEPLSHDAAPSFEPGLTRISPVGVKISFSTPGPGPGAAPASVGVTGPETSGGAGINTRAAAD